MRTLVIDTSIAVKWVVEEEGTPEALALSKSAKLIAPELLVAGCANILWKKVQRKELAKQEALLAARLLQGAEIELIPMRFLFEAATKYQSISTIPLTIACTLRWQSRTNVTLLQQTSACCGRFISVEKRPSVAAQSR